ncbi:MAG: hypothetical protein Q8P67_11655 [archaeon]|nr:hypothetical protein [archaeon]
MTLNLTPPQHFPGPSLVRHHPNSPSSPARACRPTLIPSASSSEVSPTVITHDFPSITLAWTTIAFQHPHACIITHRHPSPFAMRPSSPIIAHQPQPSSPHLKRNRFSMFFFAAASPRDSFIVVCSLILHDVEPRWALESMGGVPDL